MKPIPALAGVHVTDEFLVYMVDSLTDPEKQGPYRVDLSNWWGWGACGCHQGCCRINPKIAKGDWSEPNICKHVILVHLFRSVQSAQQDILERNRNRPYNPSEPDL